jgi:8-oxo-dGTP pyrophosphatase MutT (NUDIX family)
MAGILFTNGDLVLAGYNQRKGITGIGGKKEDDELPYQTAVRETLEELLELKEIPDALLKNICDSLTFEDVVCHKDYATFLMNFEAIDKILTHLRLYELESKVYNVIPKNLQDLLFTRKRVPGAEFTHLVLLPFDSNITIDRNIVKDINTFKTCDISMW